MNNKIKVNYKPDFYDKPKKPKITNPDGYIHFLYLNNNSKTFNQDLTYCWERRLANEQAMRTFDIFVFNVRVVLRYRNMIIREFKAWLRTSGSPIYRFFISKHKLMRENKFGFGHSMRPIYDLTDLIMISEKINWPLTELLTQRLDTTLGIDMTKPYRPRNPLKISRQRKKTLAPTQFVRIPNKINKIL